MSLNRLPHPIPSLVNIYLPPWLIKSSAVSNPGQRGQQSLRDRKFWLISEIMVVHTKKSNSIKLDWIVLVTSFPGHWFSEESMCSFVLKPVCIYFVVTHLKIYCLTFLSAPRSSPGRSSTHFELQPCATQK